MLPEIIFTKDSPVPVGPYSQAVRAGNLVFISGQLPLLPATGELVPGDVIDQARQVLDNLTAVLIAAGSSRTCVVKTTIFLKDMNDFPRVNALYGEYFPAHPPARSTVQVARLPKDVLVEIEAVATVD
ncbi:MAG TPA: RidA family protein [bacterium]|nr:RidA family protein [bacterium]